MRFEPVELKAAEPGWFVRVTLPHGEQIHINEFKTETEAKDWIADKAAAWLIKYEAAGMLSNGMLVLPMPLSRSRGE